jgi:DNA-binding NtrC family response regulator
VNAQPYSATPASLGSGIDASCEWVTGHTTAIRRVVQHCKRVANVQCSALITGETGTGKEVCADLIRRSGPRADKPFIPVNCGALPSSLAESQLFGYEKGAFTGAAGSSRGIFRAAEGGIVFLDEIGELPIDLQPKLLRVLQQHEVRPIGACQAVPIDVQVIAATNRDLEVEVAAGRFREDLYYRLNLVQLRVPPLRERVQDIPLFIEFFSAKFARRYCRPVWRPDEETLRQFCEAPWPGNIRQLSHVIERSYVLDCAPSLSDLDEPTRNPTHAASFDRAYVTVQSQLDPSPARARSSIGSTIVLPDLNLEKLRNEAVRQALQLTCGHKGRAAKLLGIHPNTLTRLLAGLATVGEEISLPA